MFFSSFVFVARVFTDNMKNFKKIELNMKNKCLI